MWFHLAILVVTTLIGFVTRPRSERPTAPGLEDISVPNSEEGRPLRYPFGTPYQGQPSVIFYGNHRTREVRSKGGKK